MTNHAAPTKKDLAEAIARAKVDANPGLYSTTRDEAIAYETRQLLQKRTAAEVRSMHDDWQRRGLIAPELGETMTAACDDCETQTDVDELTEVDGCIDVCPACLPHYSQVTQ